MIPIDLHRRPHCAKSNNDKTLFFFFFYQFNKVIGSEYEDEVLFCDKMMDIVKCFDEH